MKKNSFEFIKSQNNIFVSFLLRKIKILSALLLILIFSSCGEKDFKVYVELNELRILALVTQVGSGTLAEASPGESVTVTPWVSDITEASSLQFAWSFCADPGLDYGQSPTCNSSTSVTRGTINTLNSGNLFTGVANSFTVSIPATALDNLSNQDKQNGINYLVVYVVTNSSGYSVSSFKRILVSESAKTTKNNNPVVNSVLANGSALGTLIEGAVYALNIDFPSSSQESYTVIENSGSTRAEVEDLRTTWFYTDGEMKYFRTVNSDKNEYTAPGAFPSRDSLLIPVVRDDRGGTWVQKFSIK